MAQNNLGCCIDFESGEGTASIYSLEELQKKGIGTIDNLPFSIRILLEQALRNVEESKSNPEYVNLLANWDASENMSEESIQKVLRKEYDLFSTKLHKLLTSFTFRSKLYLWTWKYLY